MAPDVTPQATPPPELAQVIYEAVWQVMVDKCGAHPGPWAKLPEGVRAAYQAGADAARAALAPAWDALAAERDRLRAAVESIAAAREMRADGDLDDDSFATVVSDALDGAQGLHRWAQAARAGLEARDD